MFGLWITFQLSVVTSTMARVFTLLVAVFLKSLEDLVPSASAEESVSANAPKSDLVCIMKSQMLPLSQIGGRGKNFLNQFYVEVFCDRFLIRMSTYLAKSSEFATKLLIFSFSDKYLSYSFGLRLCSTVLNQTILPTNLLNDVYLPVLVITVFHRGNYFRFLKSIYFSSTISI